jgi:hypothetical protein
MIEGHAFFVHRADALAGRNDAAGLVEHKLDGYRAIAGRVGGAQSEGY